MTNSIVQTEFGILDQTLAIRHEILSAISDDDLAFTLPGNPSFGEVCKRMGDTDQMYIDSFTTFTMDYATSKDDATLATSVDALKTWFTDLERDMKTALSAIPQSDLDTRMIERGFSVPIRVQFHIYREALLIFYAKAVVYFNAMGKPLPKQLGEWIG